jgi:ankyrin repeat protein
MVTRASLFVICVPAIALAAIVMVARSRPQPPRMSLHEAASMGDAAELQRNLRSGADPGIRDAAGLTALHHAVKSVASMEPLIRVGVDVNARAANADTPLHSAIRQELSDAATFLLEHGASVNSANDSGQTPLHLASGNGSLRTIEALIERGASIETRDTRGSTPLHWAIANSQIEAAKLLVERGADVNAASRIPVTPLARSALNGQQELLRYLSSKGAKHKDPDHTLMHYAALAGCYAEQVDLLLMPKTDPADLETVNRLKSLRMRRNELLHPGSAEVIQYLARTGISPNVRGPRGRTALHYAAMGGNRAAFDALIAVGADLSMRDHDGRRPAEVETRRVARPGALRPAAAAR